MIRLHGLGLGVAVTMSILLGAAAHRPRHDHRTDHDPWRRCPGIASGTAQL
ncbi:hypothetical protein [Nocardia araoensis]|uniref:hypothetical protein n=1 Tax=Nocardia araoensis TaxID=228600 RepID=UPI0012F6C1DD|nr:hypothetical protein [Nocardia araoensis]